MRIQFRSTASGATAERLEELEAGLCFQLPEGYRHFLAEHDGGRPVTNSDTSPEGRELGVSVTRFFGTQELISERLKWEERVPSDLLVIADAAGGNLVCLSVRAKDTGAVYFWDHEAEGGEGEALDFRNVTLLAPSFEAFLDGLEAVNSADPEVPTDVREVWVNPEFLARLKDGG